MIIRQTYRIYPNKAQQDTLSQWLGQARYIWNYMLDINIEKYKNSGTFAFEFDMNNMLPELKKSKETSWLSEIPSQALQQKCHDLSSALNQTFKSSKNKKAFPKFKSRKTDNSGIRIPSFKLKDGAIFLPKMKQGIKIKLHRELLGKSTSVTLYKDKSECYFASIIVNVSDNTFPPEINNIRNSIGIDLGIKYYAVASNGEVIKNPKFQKESEKKITKARRSLSRKKIGSNNREDARKLLAKIYKKVINRRKDFIYQVASSITKKNDLIAIETLNVSGMMKNTKLAKSIADVSWSIFTNALSWQAKKRGKHLIKIDTWFPSSKLCSCCGYKKKDLNLGDRTYSCTNCGTSIDRDLNAAFNIQKEGLKQYNTAGTAEIYACRDINLDVKDLAQEIIHNHV